MIEAFLVPAAANAGMWGYFHVSTIEFFQTSILHACQARQFLRFLVWRDPPNQASLIVAAFLSRKERYMAIRKVNPASYHRRSPVLRSGITTHVINHEKEHMVLARWDDARKAIPRSPLHNQIWLFSTFHSMCIIGLEVLTRTSKRHYPQLSVLILSMHDESSTGPRRFTRRRIPGYS